MTRTELRVGVAGCGTIARHVHLPLLHGRPDTKLVAVADSNPQALDEVVRRFHGVQPYPSVEEMLRKATLDAVVVAVPPSLHADAARSVLDAGLHLYLEKPMATTLDDGAAIVRSWRGSGRVAMMGFNCRANPLYLRLRELMRAGRAGRIVYVQTFFSTAPRPLPEWKRQRASGGGALLDLGVHHIDLVRFLTGREVTGVRATMSSRASEHDTVLLELQLEDGTGAHGFFSVAAAEGDRVEVHGETARLTGSRYAPLDVQISDNPGDGLGGVGRALRRVAAVRHLARVVEARRSPFREPGYAVLLDRFIRAGLTGASVPDTPGIADGFAATAVVAAAELSLETGRMETPVAFADVPA